MVDKENVSMVLRNHLSKAANLFVIQHELLYETSKYSKLLNNENLPKNFDSPSF